MTIQTQSAIDKKDRDELIDFSIRLGQSCWNVYCLSKSGFVRVFMLPNNTVRQQANELFQVGFTSRLLFYPPCGTAAPDAGTELDMGEKAWQEYLDTMEGEVVLDAAEHVVRTISSREGQELSPLPVIYNFRSEVSNGETTVHWSTTRCETDECVFGVWLSQTSPVDTTLPANETIFYSRELTQYQLGIIQSEPKYVAVTAIRTGNTEEVGPVCELFLPWSSEKPRAPDDAVVLPQFMTPVSQEETANNP